MPKKTRYIKPNDQNKSWFKKVTTKNPYRIESIEPTKSFLIVCEGVNTEPAYFRSFPVVTVTVECKGAGASRLSLVSYAFELSKLAENKGKEVWCVFDFDYKKDVIGIAHEFNEAVEFAQKKGLNVAYSNDSFELWFILHYQFLETKHSRFEYYTKLDELWDVRYERVGKTYEFCKTIYSRLEKDPNADVSKAIKNARRFFEEKADLPPSHQNPSTKVYELVEKLLKYLKK